MVNSLSQLLVENDWKLDRVLFSCHNFIVVNGLGVKNS